MAKDALLSVSKTLPNAAANNATIGIDLNIDPANLTTGKSQSNKWRLLYAEANIPALSDHTNTSITNLIVLQDSADNATFANTNPSVIVSLVGVASTGSVAVKRKLPLPPEVRRYIRFQQFVPTNGGTGSNATVYYDLVT